MGYLQPNSINISYTPYLTTASPTCPTLTSAYTSQMASPLCVMMMVCPWLTLSQLKGGEYVNILDILIIYIYISVCVYKQSYSPQKKTHSHYDRQSIGSKSNDPHTWLYNLTSRITIVSQRLIKGLTSQPQNKPKNNQFP